MCWCTRSHQRFRHACICQCVHSHVGLGVHAYAGGAHSHPCAPSRGPTHLLWCSVAKPTLHTHPSWLNPWLFWFHVLPDPPWLPAQLPLPDPSIATRSTPCACHEPRAAMCTLTYVCVPKPREVMCAPAYACGSKPCWLHVHQKMHACLNPGWSCAHRRMRACLNPIGYARTAHQNMHACLNPGWPCAHQCLIEVYVHQ